MVETNFNIAKGFLKAALTELKKGEHDQLMTSLKRMSEVRQDTFFYTTFEEALNILIEGVEIIRVRWESLICEQCGDSIPEEDRWTLPICNPCVAKNRHTHAAKWGTYD